MRLVLDAAALLAIERGGREIMARVKGERQQGRALVTHGGVIGQVWRGGTGRQAELARFLPGVEVHPIDDTLGRRAGLLLAASGLDDVIDASLVALAADGDEILTSDAQDLHELARAAGTHVDLIEI